MGKDLNSTGANIIWAVKGQDRVQNDTDNKKIT
jgi:hypothetical protein